MIDWVFANPLNFILLLLGAIIGATFADIDLAPPLPLKHRSAWTHGPLIPYLVPYLVGLYPILFYFCVGFLPAYSLHLLLDMFPKSWHGGAHINLFPIPFSLPAPLSFIFLGVGVFFGVKIFLQLIEQEALLWNYLAYLS